MGKKKNYLNAIKHYVNTMDTNMTIIQHHGIYQSAMVLQSVTMTHNAFL